MADVGEMSDAIADGSECNEESFVIFADGTGEGADDMNHLVPAGDETQQLAIGDDGITIVVTPENEHQVSELLRALQASQGDDVQILTDTGAGLHGLVKIKEEDSANEVDEAEQVQPKKKRGRPSKQEADASVAEGVSNLKSSRLREKAAKQGGLKKLWLTLPKEDSMESLEETIQIEADPIGLRSDGEGEMHQCEICPEEEFESLEDLKNHRKEIHPASFHCDICGIGFEDQIGFFEHLKTHYEKVEKPKKMRGRPRKNPVASTSTASTSKSCDEMGNLMCNTCQKEFRNVKALDAHVRNAHPDAITKAYHCAQCNTSFRFKEAMETHLENVHGISGEVSTVAVDAENIVKIETDDVEDDIEDEDNLELIEGMEHGERIVGQEPGEAGEFHVTEEDGEDEDGDPDVENEEDLEALQASGVTDYDPAIDGHCCQLCGAVFSAKKRLIQHLKEDHHIGFRRGRRPKYPPVETAEDGTYPCPTCHRSFTHKNSLAYHLRTHAGDRPHQCEICGKSFYANGALKVHMRVHTGARPYKCDECGREFRQWGDLKYHHTSLHSGIRQYQCEYCGKSFARKYSLIVHRRVHTGERNYKCDFCGKGFRASSYLLNHRRIHTGEKPHPCPVCLKPFRMRSDMKRHMQMHARDGSDVSLLLAIEQGEQSFDGIAGDSDALAALREKAGIIEVKRGDRSRRVLKHGKSEEAAAVATIQDDDEEEGEVMLTIMPNEDGEMVAVPIHVRNEDDDASKSMSLVESVDNADSHEGQVMHLINEDGEVQEGLEAVTMRDPDTNTVYVWSVFPNTPSK